MEDEHEDFIERLQEEEITESKSYVKEIQDKIKTDKTNYKLKEDKRIERDRYVRRYDLEDEDDEEKSSFRPSSGVIAATISILVVVIVGVGVAIPVLQDTLDGVGISPTTIDNVSNASLTSLGGVGGTILNLIPLMVGLVLFVALGALISFRT